MTSKAPISRDVILDAAYRQAQRDGIASLSIRGISAECGVAVGSIYNHFPDKASLVTEVISRFWEQTARGAEGRACFQYRSGQNLVSFCKQVASGLESALAQFRSDWLAEVSSLDARTLQRGRAAEKECFRHIEQGFQVAIANDPSIDPRAIDEIGTEALAHFIWSNMLQSLKDGDRECTTLIAVLRRALYREQGGMRQAAKTR